MYWYGIRKSVNISIRKCTYQVRMCVIVGINYIINRVNTMNVTCNDTIIVSILYLPNQHIYEFTYLSTDIHEYK